MPKLAVAIPNEYLHVLNVDDMLGRYVQIPAKDKVTKRHILLLYGHHSTLERMYSTGQYLSRYGTVTIMDMPGFGGMDSFYKVGITPSLEAYADYIKKAIRLIYKQDQRFSTLCMSLSFMFYARAMQLDSSLVKRTDTLIAFVGFLNRSDFRYGWFKHAVYSSLTWLLSRPPLTLLARLVLFNKILLGPLLRLFFMLNPHYKAASQYEQADVEAMERDLWLRNDLRTHFETVNLMLNAAFPNVPINHPVINVLVDKDQYFDRRHVQASMERIFSTYTAYEARIDAHAPSIISTEDEVAELMPQELEQELAAA